MVEQWSYMPKVAGSNPATPTSNEYVLRLLISLLVISGVNWIFYMEEISMGKPTLPNRTNKATAADLVMTPIYIARIILEKFKPQGLILEPCRGTGNIYNQLPEPKDWCEITQGRDFFSYHRKVDWIITNPPYSIYDKFLQHCFELADNVVLLSPIAKAFKSMKIEKMVDEYGGLKIIWLIGSGTKCGFAFGFPTGCLHYQRGYKGKIERVVGF